MMGEGNKHRHRMVFQINKTCFETVDEVSRDVCPAKRSEDYDVKADLHEDCLLTRAQFPIAVNDARCSLWRFDRVSAKLNVDASGTFLYGWRLMVHDNVTGVLSPAFSTKVPIVWAGTADVSRQKVTSDQTVEKGVRTAWKDSYHGALTNETRCDEARPDEMSVTKSENVAAVFGTPLLKHLVEREFAIDIDDFHSVDHDRQSLVMPKRQENFDEYERLMKENGYGREEIAAARFENVIHDALRTCGRLLRCVSDLKYFENDSSFKCVKNEYLVPMPVVKTLVTIVEHLHTQSNYVLMSDNKTLVLEVDRFSDTSADTLAGSIELVMEYSSDVLMPADRPWSIDQLIENDVLKIHRTTGDVFTGCTGVESDDKKDDDDDDYDNVHRRQYRAEKGGASNNVSTAAARGVRHRLRDNDADQSARNDPDNLKHRIVPGDRERLPKGRRFAED